MWETLGRHYLAGGWVMHPISACSILALAAVIYKIAQLGRTRLDAAPLLGEVRTQLLNGRLKEALDTCGRIGTPAANVVRAGLLKQGAPRVEIESAMEATALRELDRLERFQGILATVVNLAPLLGLLGTVWGMIVAFGVIYEQGLANPALVAGGISQALYTTAWGLIVAAFALPFHNWFASRITAHSRILEIAADTLLETYSEMERMGTRA
jgi:biopolymer transport protein ExbB